MAMTFFAVQTLEQAKHERKQFVMLEEETWKNLHDLAMVEGLNDTVLWDLDPYAVTFIPNAELTTVVELCEQLLGVADIQARLVDVYEFVNGLKGLSQVAINSGLPLLAVGD